MNLFRVRTNKLPIPKSLITSTNKLGYKFDTVVLMPLSTCLVTSYNWSMQVPIAVSVADKKDLLQRRLLNRRFWIVQAGSGLLPLVHGRGQAGRDGRRAVKIEAQRDWRMASSGRSGLELAERLHVVQKLFTRWFNSLFIVSMKLI